MLIHRGQGPTRLSLAARESGRIEIPSLVVAVAQPSGAASVWTLRVEGRLNSQGVTRELGRIETIPPTVWAPSGKVVAIASCPGVVDWWVEVEYLRTRRAVDNQGQIDDHIEVDLSASMDQTLPGVTVIDGASRLQRGRYSYQAGTLAPGATTITTPSGLLQTVSAWQVGTGMTVAVDAFAPAPVPPNGSIQFGPQGSELGPISITFANVPVGGGGYLIEVTV
jgi:hypothetical protein